MADIMILKESLQKWLTRVSLLYVAVLLATVPALTQNRNILFIAGAPSHGFGNHEHLGGSKVLAQTLNEANVGVRAEVSNGWPEDESMFDDVDAVVIFSNGGGTHHPLMERLDNFRPIMDRGVGLVNLHYAVEIPEGAHGDAFLEWVGGYFEMHWSVNPFWVARFEEFPDHPISNGVKPFQALDEWYYHMRFPENMKNVTPILTDLPPRTSLTRNDGPHHNNPHVREAVLERREAQHTAWAYERPGGGRGFSFTGAHYHWNWGIDEFRRVVANAIVWSAGAEVPANGVPVQPVTVQELMELADDPVPNRYPHRIIQFKLDKINGRNTEMN